MNDPGVEASIATGPEYVPSEIKFPVVGIGASAGGLQALTHFLEGMPADNGMAFVIVLHLSPKHPSAAAHLLQRVTSMPVMQVVEPTRIEVGNVYVIAPNMQLTMVDGYLNVTEMERPRGNHVAIDVFFRALAEVHRERSIAIVLSGTGSDGAVGVARIKEKGGVTFAQAPSDAEHEGMPQAAIRTGLVDFVLPVVDMAQKLVDLWRNARRIELPSPTGDILTVLRSDKDDVAVAEKALQQVIEGLRTHTGHDFRHYKRATVLRRIERRMQVRSVHTLPDYSTLLEGDAREYDALLSDMLISVTNFFRDRESFEALERDIVPELFKDKVASDSVRVWVAGCATGEEAYSIAMLLADQASEIVAPPVLQVFASDIDEQAIAEARSGNYPASIITDVAPVRLRQYFSKEDGRYRIRKAIRDRVLFAAQNVLRDPPFSRVDLVTCRNLLIYLNRDVQAKVLEMFHFALRPGGYLFLGSSESAESASDFFTVVDKKNRIYRARPMARTSVFHGQVAAAAAAARTPELIARKANQRHFSYAEVHQRALMQASPPSVILDRDSNIVHMSASATPFMRMVGGEPSRNVLALILPELRLELRSALFQALQASSPVPCRPVAIDIGEQKMCVTMQVTPYHDGDGAGDFSLVMFEVAPRPTSEEPAHAAARTDDVVLAQLEDELQRKKDQLQETIEQSEISTEELRASNEELQAINEELRSATEELETSKEELQSVNEELITVNYELKVRVEETSKANDDLNNLIASTDIATIFVDSALRIKRFTPRAADIFSIIQADIGRSLLDLTHRLDYDELAEDVGVTFDKLRVVEREVHSSDGRSYIVRLLPYRTMEDRIEGAVMTFFDITARRQAEDRLAAKETRMRLVAESTKDYAIITTDADGAVVSWNKGAERVFGYTEAEITGADLDCLSVPDDRANGVVADEMRQARVDGRAEYERWYVRNDGERVFCSGITTPLGPGAAYGFAKIARDQTARNYSDHARADELSSEQLGRSNAESEAALKDEFLAIMSHELRHPLNMIHVNAEMLTRLPEVAESPTAERAVRQVRAAVLSQAKIIDDLLDMSRLRTGKLTMAVMPVDIRAMAETMAEAARGDPGSTNLAITVSGEPGPVMVSADPVRLEQVLMNLLSNAIKFTPLDGRIDIAIARADNMARITVSDTGQGISAAFLPKVFEMFGQAGSVTTRAKGGLGIGLALVREIIELHGGMVEAASAGAGQGAQISVSLPLVDAALALTVRTNVDSSAALQGANILPVDDAAEIVFVFKTLLELEGARVVVATDGAQGLLALGETSFDVLISDISMPGMDGYEFLRAVRLQPGNAQIPAIALSGLVREKDIAMAREAGFSAHLGKPVSMDRLIATLKELVGSNDVGK